MHDKTTKYGNDNVKDQLGAPPRLRMVRLTPVPAAWRHQIRRVAVDMMHALDRPNAHALPADLAAELRSLTRNLLKTLAAADAAEPVVAPVFRRIEGELALVTIFGKIVSNPDHAALVEALVEIAGPEGWAEAITYVADLPGQLLAADISQGRRVGEPRHFWAVREMIAKGVTPEDVEASLRSTAVDAEALADLPLALRAATLNEHEHAALMATLAR